MDISMNIVDFKQLFQIFLLLNFLRRKKILYVNLVDIYVLGMVPLVGELKIQKNGTQGEPRATSKTT